MPYHTPGMLYYHTPVHKVSATKGQLLHLTRSGQPGTKSNWNRQTPSLNALGSKPQHCPKQETQSYADHTGTLKVLKSPAG